MSLQPVSMLMSNLNVESAAHQAPNALAAAQDTGQRQEIVQEGIRATQRVQASDAAAEMQRVHRKSPEDEREGNRGRREQDSYERTKAKHKDEAAVESAPLIQNKQVRSRKSFEFLA